MKSIILCLFASVLFFGYQSWANTESFSEAKRKYDADGVELYKSNSELKAFRRLGGGLSIGGELGLVGAFAEVNLDTENALRIGLGTGPSYGTAGFSLKKNYEAQYISPYTKVGYSKWYSTTGDDADDSSTLSQIYSKQDLESRNFNADFLLASFGVEYNQLEGELSGLNIIGEVTLMGEIKKTQLVPTGSVGIVYFY